MPGPSPARESPQRRRRRPRDNYPRLRLRGAPFGGTLLHLSPHGTPDAITSPVVSGQRLLQSTSVDAGASIEARNTHPPQELDVLDVQRTGDLPSRGGPPWANVLERGASG